jgi:hypothetical protein
MVVPELSVCPLDNGHVNYNLQLMERAVRFHGRLCSRAKPTDATTDCYIKIFWQNAGQRTRFSGQKAATARPKRGQSAAAVGPWSGRVAADGRPDRRLFAAGR